MLLWALSLGLLVTGLAYLAHVTAERTALARERVRQKQEDSAQALGLLLEMLTALKVGVEVRDEHGRTILENAGNVASTPAAASAIERARQLLDTDATIPARYFVNKSKPVRHQHTPRRPTPHAASQPAAHASHHHRHK